MLPPPNQAPLPAGVQPTDPTSPRSMEGCYLQQVRGTLGTWPKAVSGRNSRTGHVSGWGTCAFRTGPAAQNGDGVDRVQASVDWDKQGPHPSSPTPQWGGGSQGRRSQRHIVTCIPGGPGILPHPCTVSACLFPAPACLCSLQRIPETCSRTSTAARLRAQNALGPAGSLRSRAPHPALFPQGPRQCSLHVYRTFKNLSTEF